MYAIDPHSAHKLYRDIAEHTDREVQRRLVRFERSLHNWLQGALNWPLEEWEADLQNFVEHSRYAGWEMSPHSLTELRGLLASRSADRRHLTQRVAGATRPAIQLAAAPMPPNDDTDATFDLSEVSDSVESETAGPGPEVTPSFKQKVRLALDLLDPHISQWWHAVSVGGLIRSRNAWGPRRNVMSQVENDRPIIVVDQSFTAGQTALAIVEHTSSGLFANSIGVHFRRYRIGRSQRAEEFAQWQKQAPAEAAAYAATMAELYYASIGSLTPSGDVFVTVDDIERNGLSWNHLLFALPAMAVFRRGIKRLSVLLKSGKRIAISGRVLDQLSKLPLKKARELIAKAEKAKSPEKAIEILEGGIHAAAATPPPSVAGATKSTIRKGTAQVHHAISKKIYRALQEHRTLRGKYKYRDPRFEFQAINYEAHHGYERWHIDLDKEVVSWIEENRLATAQEFENWLAWRYRQPDIEWRFKAN